MLDAVDKDSADPGPGDKIKASTCGRKFAQNSSASSASCVCRITVTLLFRSSALGGGSKHDEINGRRFLVYES